ncbi:MAG: hypothetical protein WKG00_14265 [Polyangiaceae bacterium]
MIGTRRRSLPRHVADRAILLERTEREALGYRGAPGGAAQLIMAWRRDGQGGRVVFMTVWLGFLGVWTGVMLFRAWPMALFGLVLIAMGARFSYGELALLVNRTRLRISSGVLQRSEGPLPAWRGWRGPIADVADVVIEETADATRVEPVRNVRARLRSGDVVDLLCDVGSAEHAARWAESIRDELRAAALSLPERSR